MKNASINRQSLVSIFTVMLLVFGVLGILFTSLLLAGCGGDEEADNAASPVSAEDKKEVLPVVGVPPEPPPLPEPPAQQQPQPEPLPLPEPPLNDLGACAIGLTLKAGESCSYVAGEANVVFFIQQDGSACREGGPVLQEVLGAQVRVDKAKFCRNDNIERDDAFKSNFAANKNPDGNWTVNSLP